jgi:hypothetical protein
MQHIYSLVSYYMGYVILYVPYLIKLYLGGFLPNLYHNYIMHRVVDSIVFIS